MGLLAEISALQPLLQYYQHLVKCTPDTPPDQPTVYQALTNETYAPTLLTPPPNCSSFDRWKHIYAALDCKKLFCSFETTRAQFPLPTLTYQTMPPYFCLQNTA